MNRKQLLNLLDLDGTENRPPGQESELPATTNTGSGPAHSTNLTAFQLDEWALRRGTDLLDGNAEIQATGLDRHAVADFHAAAFEPGPLLQDGCVDPDRHEFLKQLLQTPDYRALHASTLLNESASEIAAAAFAKRFAGTKPPSKVEGSDDEAPDDKISPEMRLFRGVARAIAEATEEVAEAREAAAAMGLGPGAPGSNDPQAIAALYRRVRGNRTLRKICELAGRFRRVAQSKQRQKATHGYDDMVGVVTDGDLGRILPHELARLAVPEFEWDTLRRLVERQTMCREYRSTEKVAKGPIIVSVDESGSMEGDKAHTAKALALALAWIARHQRRWCGLVAYSGDTGERLLSLPPGRWNEAALMDWLEPFLGCGSDLDVPVREMPDYYKELGAPRGKTDVVFITDAICRIPDEIQARFLVWKSSAQARLITLVINSGPGDLAALSDEWHRLPALSAEEPGVERVLSI